jgi:uncharacterized membrane protein
MTSLLMPSPALLLLAAPQWVEQLGPSGAVALLSILPACELSVAIPYGILGTSLPAWHVVLLALACNMLVAPLVWLFMTYILKLVTRWRPVGRAWEWFSERVQRKLSGAMNRWGKWGVFVLVAIPGPGSGLYTLSVGSFLLGLEFRSYILIALLGQLVAASLVTLAALTGNQAMEWMMH